MTAEQLFQNGELDEAVKALTVEVKANPTDSKRRTFLFELLCFAGEYARAEKQLDVLSQGGPQSDLGAQIYRGTLAAERTRQELFEKGEPSKPLETASGTKVVGSINGQRFQTLSDSDSRVGASLEMFAAGTYLRIPYSLLSSIRIEPPRRLRDLLWLPAQVCASADFQGRPLGEVFLPVLHPFSWQSSDPQVRLGRATAWEETASGEVLPRGQKMLAADDEEWPLLSLRALEFEVAQAAP
jgi:type VI secretion system protein ImpE